MEAEIAKLKETISELEEELLAETQRKETEDGGASKSNGRGGLKQKIKESPIGRMAADPNSKAGKIIRLPRTVYRIVLHPTVMKDIFATHEEVAEEKPLFVPIEFFVSDYDKTRFNVVMEEFDEKMLKMAAELAKTNKAELRVITCSEEAATMKYKKLVEKGKIPKVDEISFYSTVDQKTKRTVFQLEVGKNDIFLTKAWMNGRK